MSSHSSISARSMVSVESQKAVKFHGKEVIPADTDGDNSYYTFSTTQRPPAQPEEAQYETVRNQTIAEPMGGDLVISITSKNGFLPSITMSLPRDQVKAIVGTLEKGDIASDEIEYLKQMLWVTQQIISSSASLSATGITNPAAIINSLTKILSIESFELQLAGLRTVLLLLQRGDVPVNHLSSVIDISYKFLEQQGEIVRASLSLLTQISFSHPLQVARPSVKRVVALCSTPDC